MPARRPALAALLLSLSPAAWPQVAAEARPTLTIGTNNTPADRRALQALGEEACRRAGVTLRLASLPSERSLFAANAGEIDGEGLRVAGLEAVYPNLLRVPEHLIGISFVAFARDDRISLAQGWAGLAPWRVAFINGWKLFEAQATRARVVHKVEQAEQLFRMLEADRIDLALYTRADGMALARNLGLAQVRPLAPALADVDMFLYLHRRHEALVPRLAQALREMKADGTHGRMLAALGTP